MKIRKLEWMKSPSIPMHTAYGINGLRFNIFYGKAGWYRADAPGGDKSFRNLDDAKAFCDERHKVKILEWVADAA